MRFHVVGLPHTKITRDFSACAFTEKVRKFAGMMTDRGHRVVVYGAGDRSEARCDEFVSCLAETKRAKYVKGLEHYTVASFDPSLPHWKTFNGSAIAAIKERFKPRDFICVIGGSAHSAIGAAFPAEIVVEFGVGYHGTFAKHRVFESYAHMAAVYAAQAKSSDIDGEWFDAVIPNYFEVDQFPLVVNKGDYFAFLGRMVDRKGVDVAVETCKALGARLVTAGPGAPLNARGVSHRGVLKPRARAQFLGNARALFVPTKYLEPFGGVAVEAMLCGTPVITTDWGAFPETVVQGVTGFRCRTLSEFVSAAMDVGSLSPATIRQHALRYSTDVVGDLYVEHFDRLSTLWGKGWYELGSS